MKAKGIASLSGFPLKKPTSKQSEELTVFSLGLVTNDIVEETITGIGMFNVESTYNTWKYEITNFIITED